MTTLQIYESSVIVAAVVIVVIVVVDMWRHRRK